MGMPIMLFGWGPGKVRYGASIYVVSLLFMHLTKAVSDMTPTDTPVLFL